MLNLFFLDAEDLREGPGRALIFMTPNCEELNLIRMAETSLRRLH